VLLSAVGLAQAEREELEELIQALPEAGEFTDVAADELHEVLLEFEGGLAARASVEELDCLLRANELLLGLAPLHRPATYRAPERLGFLREALRRGATERRRSLAGVSVQCVYLLQLEGRHEEVERLVEEDLELVQRPGDRYELRLRAAQSALARDRYTLAEEHLRAIERELPERTPVQEVLLSSVRTELDLGLGRLDEAIRSVVHQLELSSQVPEAYRLRAQQQYCETLLAVGRPRRCLERIEALLVRSEGLDELALSQLVSIRAIASYVLAVRGELSSGSARSALTEVVESGFMPAEDRCLALLSLAELDSAEGDLGAARDKLAELESLAGSPVFEARMAAVRHRIARNKSACSELVLAWERMIGSWREIGVRSGGVGLLEFGPRRLVASELVRATILHHPGEEGRRKALAHIFAAQELGRMAREGGYRTRSLQEIVARLTTEDSGLLVFLSGLRSSHVFAVDPRGVAHAEVSSVWKLHQLGGEWWSRVRSRPRTEGKEVRRAVAVAGEPLAELLFPDVISERIARWSSVTVVGDAFLGYMPLEALPLGSPAGDALLGTRKALDHLPSVPVGMLLKERSLPESELDLVLVAGPTLSEEALRSVQPLPIEGRQADRLTRGFDARRVRSWSGDEATRDALVRPEVSRARLLHLFVHGVTLEESRRRTGLALAPSPRNPTGFLDCEFVERHVKAPPVVLLSACRAGSGKARRGDDGPANLGGAFLEAGARVVVLSPVDLEEGAQSRFAESFQRSLLAGSSVREAARVARAALAEREETAHPYYGSMIVLGDGDLRPFE